MTSVKVKFSPSSVILKEGTVHYQIIHHCKVRHIRTGYKLFPSEWISASGEINVSAGSGEGRKSYLAALKNQIDKDLFRIKKCHILTLRFAQAPICPTTTYLIENMSYSADYRMHVTKSQKLQLPLGTQ